jgi:hypothetical protein
MALNKKKVEAAGRTQHFLYTAMTSCTSAFLSTRPHMLTRIVFVSESHTGTRYQMSQSAVLHFIVVNFLGEDA